MRLRARERSSMAGRSTLSGDRNRLTWPHGQRADPRGVFPDRRGAEEGGFLLPAKALGCSLEGEGRGLACVRAVAPGRPPMSCITFVEMRSSAQGHEKGAVRIGSAFETSLGLHQHSIADTFDRRTASLEVACDG